MNVRDHFEELCRDGFTIIRAAHPPVVVAEWHAIAQQLAVDDEAKRTVGNFIETHTALALRTIANPHLLDMAEMTMGPFVQLDGLTLVSWPPARESAEEARQAKLHWHRDPWSQVPRSGVYERPLGINMLMYLQDLDEKNGPLRVIVGSHRAAVTIAPADRTEAHAEEHLIFARRGDVIVMHNGLVHSRSPNRSDKLRSYVSVYYNLSWLRSSSRHDGPAAKRILALAEEQNDRRLMRLLGVDSELEARTNSGFLTPDEECWRDWIREDRAVLRPIT
ncbi:MAG: Phytanoyl-CoA dioxygenase [Gemmatimonadetes bacterium]|nr:Phytanoyl-CoA dioxygenase [Gemmatimonadota bacterium]